MPEKEENRGSLVLNVWPDVGRALNLSKPTVYGMVRQGVIPSIRFGRRVVVPRKALEELLASATRREDNGSSEERRRSHRKIVVVDSMLNSDYARSTGSFQEGKTHLLLSFDDAIWITAVVAVTA